MLQCRQPLRLACVHVWDSIFNYPGNTARCSITLAMAVIKSSKIFISIRHPHATCIINAQRKDTATFSTSTRSYFHHHIPSIGQLLFVYISVCVAEAQRNGKNTPQGGQRAASLHSGTTFRHLHSRCARLLSLCPDSLWECFVWGNSISSLPCSLQSTFLCCGLPLTAPTSTFLFSTFPTPLCLSIP